MSEERAPLDPVVKTLLVLVSVLVLIFGIVGNFFTCFVVFRKPPMRSAINLLLSTVALTDFLLVTFCFPLNVVSLFTSQWLHVRIACKSHAFLHSLFLVENASILTAISVDHYLILVRRHDRFTTAHARLIILVTCTLSICLCLPGLLREPGYCLPDPGFTQCEVAAATAPAERMYVALRFLAVFFVPTAVISFAFARIVGSVRNNCLRIGSYPVVCAPYSNPAKRYVIASPKKPHCFFDDMRFKTRTFSTVSILFIAFVLCRAPYAIGLTTMNLVHSNDVTTHTVLLWWNYLNSALNPIIYAWRIRKLREAYGRCFPRICSQFLHLTASPKIKPYTIGQMNYRTINSSGI